MLNFRGTGSPGITRRLQNQPCHRGTEKIPVISENLSTVIRQVAITVISTVLSDFTGFLHLLAVIQNNSYITNFKTCLDVRLVTTCYSFMWISQANLFVFMDRITIWQQSGSET